MATGDNESEITDGVAGSSGPVSLRDAWLRARRARKELGLAEAALADAWTRFKARDHAAAAQTARPVRATALDDLDWPEPLSDEDAERMFLGTALRFAPGLADDTEAVQARMAADGVNNSEIARTVLALARQRVFGKV